MFPHLYLNHFCLLLIVLFFSESLFALLFHKFQNLSLLFLQIPLEVFFSKISQPKPAHNIILITFSMISLFWLKKKNVELRVTSKRRLEGGRDRCPPDPVIPHPLA